MTDGSHLHARGSRHGLCLSVIAAGLLVGQPLCGQAAEPVNSPPPNDQSATTEASRPESGRKTPPSGLALPRFVSLKADKVHVRQGPGTDHKIAWVFQQAGLPVEVIQEFETWRRVRDSDGATGWVFHAMLSGRRTVLVLPWELKAGELKAGELKAGELKAGELKAGELKPGESKAGAPVQTELRASGAASSATVVIVEAGVLANVRTCNGTWCEVSVGPHSGHIEQKKLWGVYEKETVK